MLTSFFTKNINDTNSTLSGMLLCISDYDLEIMYHRAKYVLIADGLTRLSSHNPDAGNNSKTTGLNVNIPDIEVNIVESRLDRIRTLTSKGDKLKLLKHYIMQGWPNNHSPCIDLIKPYFTYRDELSVVDSIVTKGQCPVIPNELRSSTL